LRSEVAFCGAAKFYAAPFYETGPFRRAAEFYVTDRLFTARLKLAGIKLRRGFRAYLKFLVPRREKFERR
jgi:hypothetical protein